MKGKNVATRFIQIIGHGTHRPGRLTATFNLTFGKLDLLKNVDIFEGLDGKVLIFSCCEVGGNTRAMEAIKEASGAAAIIAYRRWIYDWHSNICEVLLYDRLITTHMPPWKVVDAVNDALEDLGIKVGPEGSKKPVLLCY